MKKKANISQKKSSNINIKNKNISEKKDKTDLYLKDSKYVEKKIIEKYLQKGFESLSVED